MIVTVTFKEAYMPHEVRRTCVNMTREQVIWMYGLEKDDIEWYRFEEE